MAERILEADLHLPALYLIKLHKGKITTTQLSNYLRDVLKPTGEDLEILGDRKDDKFSQIVRNLTAEKRNFVKSGFIERKARVNSPLSITQKGINYLNKNIELVEYLIMNDFAFDDAIKPLRSARAAHNRKIEIFDENVIISEGGKKIIKKSVYERSKKLRDYALQHFIKEGRLSCRCCGFNYEDFYGVKLGKGFIEIHHTKPIFKYATDDMENTLEKAVKNLIPVCSNCHRIIHRNWSKPKEIKTLIDAITTYGLYERKE